MMSLQLSLQPRRPQRAQGRVTLPRDRSGVAVGSRSRVTGVESWREHDPTTAIAVTRERDTGLRSGSSPLDAHGFNPAIPPTFSAQNPKLSHELHHGPRREGANDHSS